MKIVKGYPTVLDMLMIVGSLLIITFIVSHITYLCLTPSSTGVEQSSLPIVALTVTYPISFLLTILFTIFYRKHRLTDHPDQARFSLKGIFKHAGAIYVLWGYLLLTSVAVVTDPLVEMFPESIEQMSQIFTVPFLPLILSTIIFAPLLEEILFRGILMSDLKRRYGLLGSILISALLFSVVHLNFVQSIAAFFSGIVLGYIFYISKSLWGAIVVHMIHNLTVVVYNKYFPRLDGEGSIRELITIDWLYYTIFYMSVVLLSIAAIRIFILCKRDSSLSKESSEGQVEEQIESIA